jgi:hypothetical protein
MVLRAIEHKIEALFEGVFGRAFRTNVQPVELARKLAKEMDDHRTVSVSRVYVPNEYTLFLSPVDREQFQGYEESLLGELEEYLSEHARREDNALLSPPRVLVRDDEDLDKGEFGIATRMVQPRGRRADPAAPAAQPEAGATMIYRAPAPEPETADEEPEPEETAVFLSWDGESRRIQKPKLVLGRSRECDIQLSDPNASRRHAELRQEGASYWIVDLDSTNGTEVNGSRLAQAKLEHGDRITIGSTEIVFERELGDA